MPLHALSRYLNTIRFMRPIQVTNRLQRKLIQPRSVHGPAPPPRAITGRWILSPQRPAQLVGPYRLRVFQHDIHLDSSTCWNDDQLSHLVRYNLHYFDDLTARGAAERSSWHKQLITRWIAENPVGQGIGWDPYPTSLRIVNWIKWALAGNHLTRSALDSLAAQTRFLSSRIEYHLMANHLVANAKALIFAGAFFQGSQADRWLGRGRRLLETEIDEQILQDGGHFERSPMYHCLILEDLLDLLNLSQAFDDVSILSRERSHRETIDRMRSWLVTMCHPDGEISFFNDAAIGIASPPAELEHYAQRLGFRPVSAPAAGLTHLAHSGYVRIQYDDHVALLDVAHVGPDYQPGHAHADTLSFEWSFRESRTIVNSGTSCYGVSAERSRQRATRAHNTVEVDGENSSEVWHGFRVARRAYPVDLDIQERADLVTVACSHDGYRRLPGRVVHRRTWHITPAQLTVSDQLTGRCRTAVARLHFHPEWTVSGKGSQFRAEGPASVAIDTSHSSVVKKTTYHPAFEVAQGTSVIESDLTAGAGSTRLTWSI